MLQNIKSEKNFINPEWGIRDELQKFLKDFLLENTSSQLLPLILHHFKVPGKMLRPQIAYKLMRSVGFSHNDSLTWGAVCELIHNASIVHDDIQDGDQFRRGQESLWFKFGINAAINIGDYFIMQSNILVSKMECDDETKMNLIVELNQKSSQLVQGQELESALVQYFDSSVLWEKYIETIQLKTSAFFTLPFSPIKLRIDGNQAQLIDDSLILMGKIFQIQDDIIDLYGNKGRNQLGMDLAEGKISSLVVQQLIHEPESSNKLLTDLLKEREETDKETILYWSERFMQSGALGKCLFLVKELNKEMDKVVEQLPKNVSVVIANLQSKINHPLQNIERNL
ncbi:MAG: polyprenyl synthetase family protein [Bdellovibrionales bacterium]